MRSPSPTSPAGEFAALRQAVKELPKRPTDDELHNVRIHTKRARYAAELASPELGKRGAKLVERAKEVQDVIGEHQDACVAEERLRALALRGGGKTGLAAGAAGSSGSTTGSAQRARPSPTPGASSTRRAAGDVRVIRAGGGVVLRDGERRFRRRHRAAVRRLDCRRARPEPGESDEDCALREVEEETGLALRARPRAGDQLVPGRSRTAPKLVRYWLMRPTDGALRPTREVDDARWVPYDEAERILSYERDRVVLRSAASD